MKRILITGANSYIGTSFEQWIKARPGEYQVDTISVRGEQWKQQSFASYDVIFHVAGIAHADIGKIKRKEEYKKKKALYYKVNRDLTIEVAKKAKQDGVKQFIFMSSILVYGASGKLGETKVITKETTPTPTNFYGNSKLQAERGILTFQSETFQVVIIRPPMIYGKEAKGNYKKLASLARRTPIFPAIPNKRSMLYIDNLCELIRLVIIYEESGIFFPQNKEYVQTAQLVKLIAGAHGKKIWVTNLVNPIIFILSIVPGKIGELVNKAFGSLVYEKNMSEYKKNRYQIRRLQDSVKQIEN